MDPTQPRVSVGSIMQDLTSRMFRRLRRLALIAACCLCFYGCGSGSHQPEATLQILRLPSGAPGGPERMDAISGRALGVRPGQQIVLYAKNDVWWVQPFRSHPFTSIGSDGVWQGLTHLGTDYAALLVDPDFHPEKQLASLPSPGNGIAAVLSAKGTATAPPPLKTIHFSGYEWTVRSGASNRGGEINAYDPENAWTDDKGYLHLRMGDRNGRWSCAEVSLIRSLGYGTYRFVVQDSSHLGTSGVLGIYTLDERRSADSRFELDIEMSQWGKPGSPNAQYVVQPYYVPGNVARFSLPSGESTHIFRWTPRVASFKTLQGSGDRPNARMVSEHTFISGVPAAAAEVVHIDLYDFHHSTSGLKQANEIVIKKFVYIP